MLHRSLVGRSLNASSFTTASAASTAAVAVATAVGPAPATHLSGNPRRLVPSNWQGYIPIHVHQHLVPSALPWVTGERGFFGQDLLAAVEYRPEATTEGKYDQYVFPFKPRSEMELCSAVELFGSIVVDALHTANTVGGFTKADKSLGALQLVRPSAPPGHKKLASGSSSIPPSSLDERDALACFSVDIGSLAPRYPPPTSSTSTIVGDSNIIDKPTPPPAKAGDPTKGREREGEKPIVIKVSVRDAKTDGVYLEGTLLTAQLPRRRRVVDWKHVGGHQPTKRKPARAAAHNKNQVNPVLNAEPQGPGGNMIL